MLLYLVQPSPSIHSPCYHQILSSVPTQAVCSNPSIWLGTLQIMGTEPEVSRAFFISMHALIPGRATYQAIFGSIPNSTFSLTLANMKNLVIAQFLLLSFFPTPKVWTLSISRTSSDLVPPSYITPFFSYPIKTSIPKRPK